MDVMAEDEANAGTRSERTGTGRIWRGMLYILLILELGYLCAEVTFNGALLNVASGAVGRPDDIDHLEHTGRLLSGFGLGLLVYGYLVTRKKPLRITKALGLLAVFPPAIAGMYFAQGMLVDKAIVERASDEERFAAIYMAHLRPALRNGTVRIEDIPLSPETMNRAESKAFLTIATPVLLHNQTLVNELVKAAPELIKYQVHSQASEHLEEAHDQYRKASKTLSQVWIYYIQSNSEMAKRLNKAKHGFGERAEITMLSAKFQGALADYREEPGQFWMPPPGLTPREFLTHPETLTHLGIDARYHHVVTPELFELAPKRFRHQPDTLVNAKPAIHAVIDYRLHKGFQEQWKTTIQQMGLAKVASLEGIPEIPLGIDEYQAFIESDWTQSVFRNTAGLEDVPSEPLVPGWDRSTFFNKVMLPQSWSEARRYTDGLPTSLNDLQATDADQQADDAIRMAYVPTIALAISLLFSFLTAGKIVSRLWMIKAGKRRHEGAVYHGVRLTIPVVVLAAVLAAPFWIRSNSLAQSGVIEAAARETIPQPAVVMLRWTLAMEPLLYPAGNTFLMLMGLAPQPELNRYAQYYDPAAEGSDHRRAAVVDELQFSMPLPVRQLQVTLRDLGYQPGPADGVIGPSTVQALKAFQADQGLPQTGRQDSETTRLLSPHR